ncbi:MAG: hypothetical protein PVI30_01460 [Myxococcales bacterium]|jgi:hypothetical protein
MSAPPHRGEQARGSRSPAQRLERILDWRLGLLLCAFAASVLHHLARVGPYVVDDAFIFLRYADNLVRGHGLVYNPGGEAVEGYSSFLWTLLLAPGLAAGLPVPLFGQVLAALFGVATLILVWDTARALFPHSRLAPWFPVLFLVTNRTFGVWAAQPMETKLFGAVLAGAFWVWVRRGFGGRLPWLGLVAGLLPLSRPEGYLFAGMIMLEGLVSGARGARLRPALWNLGACIAVVGGHLAFRVLTYGDLLPNTFYAKVPGLRLQAGAHYLWELVRANHLLVYGALTVLGVVPFLRGAGLHGPRRFAVLSLGLTCLYAWVIGGDYFEFRFVDHVLPFWAYLTLAGIERVVGWLDTERARRRVMRAAVVLVIGANAFTILVPYAGGPELTSPEREAGYTAQFAMVGRWLGANLQPGESIAIRPAGVIAYLTRAPTLDLLGLNDRRIARMDVGDEGVRVAGHLKEATVAEARARGITYHVGHPQLRPRPCVPGSCICAEIAPGVFFWFDALSSDASLRPRLYRLGEHRGSLRGFRPRAAPPR